MTNISALLNPEPSANGWTGSPPPPSASKVPAAVDTMQAADALATLATVATKDASASAHPLSAPLASRKLSSPTTPFSVDAHSAPVEPQYSPGLDRYHHGSRSPEQERRMAIKALTSPVNVPPSAHTVVPAPALPDATEHAYRDAMTPPQALSTDAVRPRPPPIVTALSAPEDVQLSPSSRHSMSAPFIKPEPSATPQQSPPPTAHASADRRVSVPETALDADTLKAIETVKQSELGLRARKPDKSLSPLDAPLPTAVPKKRSAPRGGPANRKGGAAKRQANKKRKVDGDAQIPLPASRVSRTPTMGSRASKRSVAGTSSASSPAVESVPTCASDEGSDASDDKATYCICRKPDNHQFMIGCDGGCDDWFHGTCVKVASEDEDLIDKFICPNCHERGKGRTTWKRMCRRTGCRRPARTTQGRQSKFCSEDCGIGFFGTLARHVDTPRTARVKRAPSSKTTPEQGSDSDDEPGLLGGVLRIKNLKSLVLACDDVGLFRRLGSGQLSPPATASSTETNLDAARLNVAGVEKDRMVALAAEQREFEVRLELLRDRETFVSLVKEQVARHAEGEPKPKEFCGYDARLAWSEREFARWRQSKAGQLALQLHTLSPTAEQTAMANGTEHGTEHDDETDDVDLVLGNRVLVGEDRERDDGKEAVCTRRRCNKHPQWQKLNLQDARFEQLEVVESLRRCAEEKRAIRERAGRRSARSEQVKREEGSELSTLAAKHQAGHGAEAKMEDPLEPEPGTVPGGR